jgi:hypothetical protein
MTAPASSEAKSIAQLISEVVELAKQVAVLNATFPSHVEWVERNVKDHEVRLRDLEQAAAKSAWIPALVTALVTGVIVAGVTTIVIRALGA